MAWDTLVSNQGLPHTLERKQKLHRGVRTRPCQYKVTDCDDIANWEDVSSLETNSRTTESRPCRHLSDLESDDPVELFVEECTIACHFKEAQDSMVLEESGASCPRTRVHTNPDHTHPHTNIHIHKTLVCENMHLYVCKCTLNTYKLNMHNMHDRHT